MASMNRFEAYGVKGMNSLPWRRSFRTREAAISWADKHDADILGTRFTGCPRCSGIHLDDSDRAACSRKEGL